jgi:LysR family glycine cleavage system transcriptional activator
MSRVIRALDDTLTELFANRSRKHLVIRVSFGFARHWLLDQLAGFARQHSDIPVRVVATVWAADLLDPSVDVDIRLASGPIVGMESHQLTHDEVFPVCSPALASGRPRLQRPADLRRHTLLTPVGFAQGWKHWFAAASLKQEGLTYGPEFDSMPLALEMAALGHGVSLARSSYAQDLLRDRKLKRLFAVTLKASDNVHLILPRRLDAASPAALFRDWILCEARGR